MSEWVLSMVPEDVFRKACDAFRSSLPEDDLRTFTDFPDARSMLQAIEKHAKSHPIHSSLLTKCCKKIHNLSTKLTPYFDIIGIFVQAHPEFAALAWGSIQLVFQVGSNHVLFLERICTMLENMAAVLPAYEGYVDKMRVRAEQQGRRVSDRLLKAMAYIYSDLIQFCFDAYKLLSKKRLGIMRLKWSFASSLKWQPFDVRYDLLLRRWQEHQKLMDLEMRVSSQVEQIQSTARLEKLIDSIEQQRGTQNEHAAELEPQQLDHLLQRLKVWINPPTWYGLFEGAQSRRCAGTTDWFLADPIVQRWFSQIDRGCENCCSSTMLTVQGKPGYGKTTLCTTLIENVQKLSGFGRRNKSTADSDQSDLAFFYFDKQRPESIQSSGAFRSILVQLLQRYGNDSEVIDIVTIIWDENHAGQLYATDQEVLCALELLVRRSGQVILVFDGIDECNDQDDFFNRLMELNSMSNSLKIGIFSRPTIKIPSTLAKHSLRLDLSSGQNHGGICSYLRPKISYLIETETLPQSTIVEDVVKKISDRANGMFLWVVLLVQYLQSPLLSIRQISEAIANLNRLQGLDSLYTAILRSLEHQISTQAKESTARAFQLVAFSYRPLRLKELECAMAIPLDRRLDPDDTIPDFENKLSLISGALMERCDDNTVRFIHLSVMEYLKDPAQSYFGLRSTNVVSNASLSHHSCASFCLSYLCFSLPAEPLSGSAQTTADRDIQQNQYPFLEYAAEFWSRHLLEGFKAVDLVSTNHDGNLTDSIISLTASFLSNEAAVSAWIEASWTFLHPPQIDINLIDEALYDKPTGPGPVDCGRVDLLDQALQCMRRLALDLQVLNDSWATVLAANPNEIWEPSVSAFTKSPFWVAVTGSKITRFASKNSNKKSVCLKSQVSSDGLRLGVAKLCPKSRIMSSTESWKVVYELWTIRPMALIYQADIEIPESELGLFIIQSATVTSEPDKSSFQFPVALSADLTSIAIPGCVARIPEQDNMKVPNKKVAQQVHCQLLSMSLKSILAKEISLHLDLGKFAEAYAILMSKSGKFLLTLHKSSRLVEIGHDHCCKLWLAAVYQNEHLESATRPYYRHIASIAFKPYSPDFRKDDETAEDEAGSVILLHPYLPMLVFKQKGCILRQTSWTGATKPMVLERRQDETVLWDFSCQGDESLKFFRTDDRKPQFSDCGNYFCGARISPLNALSRLCPIPGSEESQIRQTRSHPTLDQKSTALQTSGSKIASMALVKPTESAVLETSTLYRSTTSAGLHSSSQLHHLSSGAVVLQTLLEDKLLISETLTQLPEWALKRCQVAVLRNPNNDEQDSSTVQIVLNEPGLSFQKYEVEATQQQNEILPLILERKRETIVTSFGRGNYSLDGGMRFQGETRKRLGWTDYNGANKKRLLEIAESDTG